MKITGKIPQGLKSRKLWVAIVSSVILFINHYWGTSISTPEAIAMLSPLLTWLGVEGYVDANRT